jgi:hypothetical protein
LREKQPGQEIAPAVLFFNGILVSNGCQNRRD